MLRVVGRTLTESEQEARRDLNLSTHRTWKVLNPNRRSDLGHFPAYLLEPGGNALPLLPPESAPRRRAGFLDHPVWVTRHRPAEQYAAGPYPNQGRGGDGLPRWVRANEAVENQDVNRFARIQASGPRSIGGMPRDTASGTPATEVAVAILAEVSLIAQRSNSAMRALYQFIEKLIERLMARNTAMISAMPSIACPVWLSVVLAIETIS